MIRVLLALVLGLMLLSSPRPAEATYIPVNTWNQWFIDAQTDAFATWSKGGQTAYYDAIIRYAEGIIDSAGEETNLVALASAYFALLQLEDTLEIHYVNERDPIKRRHIKLALDKVREAKRAIASRFAAFDIPESRILDYIGKGRQVYLPPPIVEPSDPRN